MPQNRQPDDWDAPLEATAAFQGLIPESVLVGRTAAALYAGHRLSVDADLTLSDLRERFAELLDRLQANSEWELDRRNAPVMIMGSFRGVETTLRQLIRTTPLETETLSVRGHTVLAPTVAEMVRIKGWLALTRNAFRDYLDFAALSHYAGDDASTAALESFDECYKDVPHRKIAKDVSPLIQLARQLAHALPDDLDAIGEVADYKHLIPRWDSWAKINAQCRHAAVLATHAALKSDTRPPRPGLAPAPEGSPPYPEHTHRAFLMSDGQTLVIREMDIASGRFDKVGNPLGPAIVGNGREVYVIHGLHLELDEWLVHPEVQQAKAQERACDHPKT